MADTSVLLKPYYYAIELDRRTDIAARSRRLVCKGRQRTGDLEQMGTEGMQRTCRLGSLPGKRKESLPDGDRLE